MAMDLPTELRRVSWRCITFAMVIGLAAFCVIGDLAAEQLSAQQVGQPSLAEGSLPLLPLQALFFVLGAGAAVGGYMGLKLLLHSLSRLRDSR